MLDHSEKSHDVAEQCDVEKLEQATDYTSNSQETFVEEQNTIFISIEARLIYMQGLKYILGNAAEWMKKMPGPV